MLLAIDIGNTNTVVGLFDGDALLHDFRIATSETRTADEYAILIRQLFGLVGPVTRAPQIDEAIVASVVPAAVRPITDALRERFATEALVVGPGIRTGMPILLQNPREVGADRIVNAVAAYERHHSGLIIVDFGTATTFDCISPKGEYLGGVICPGITISADALYHHAAKLPRVEIARPARAVGRDTVASMQSGLYYGYAAMVDGLVARMRGELAFPVKVIATGGLARLLAEDCACVDEVDELLTLVGLRLIYQRNQP